MGEWKAGDRVATILEPDSAGGAKGAANQHRAELPLRLCDFHAVLSLKVDGDEHINIMELNAFVAALRWVTRQLKRHNHRIACLLDSKVALGALSKRRSSSWPLNRVVR